MAAEAEESNEDLWMSLPEHIIEKIFLYLEMQDRFNAACSCRSWYNCFHLPSLWRRLTFSFTNGNEYEANLKCLEFHGDHFQDVSIHVDQHETSNRVNACKFIEKLAAVDQRHLSSFKMNCVGENPLFYGGKEFIAVLLKLFGPQGELLLSSSQSFVTLKHVDLSGISFTFGDNLINALIDNNPNLESLNLLNRSLVCQVSAVCVNRLVQTCRKLRHLSVYHCSLCDEALLSLAEDNRKAIETMVIACRWEEKYTQKWTSEAWSQLVQKSPELRVNISFDHTCPLEKVSEILIKEMPIYELRLETFTMIYDEVNMATRYYSKTLEKIVLQTRNSTLLSQALIDMAKNCHKLRCMLVYCPLTREVVEEILHLLPEMRESGNYILRWRQSEMPGPWIVGVEEDHVDEAQLMWPLGGQAGDRA